MTSARIIDRDLGADKLVATLNRLAGKTQSLTVGIHEDKGAQDRDGATLATIAAIHEFGAPDAGIPERSFLRAYIDEKQGELLEVAQALEARVLEGALTPDQALELLGAQMVGGIQKRISDGISPPNAPSTIARKGSSKPLIDTGVLRSAITYEVEESA